MDLTESIQARSDQVNADDLIQGPTTYTVREVVGGKAEQPFDFMLIETDRAYRPSKTMRRVIVAAWGPEASNYAGKRLTLYREPSIQFGGKAVGGIRISAMSHIDSRVEIMLQTSRGKREKFTVEPLQANSNPEQNLKLDPAAEMVAAFEQRAGINRANLEARIGRPVTEWTTEDLADLRTLGGQIARGEKTVEDVFGAGES